jgi:diadenosine tetraphosphate (Ap4A) HIT family hydrolase
VLHILEKFNERENLVKEYKYWKLLLKESPNKLGRMVAVLKREAFPLRNILPEEMEEYALVAKDAESSLEKAFGSYLSQHLHLAFVDKQIHFHIIPRYKDTVDFAGVLWEDDQHPDPRHQEKVDVDRAVLKEIREEIKKHL